MGICSKLLHLLSRLIRPGVSIILILIGSIATAQNNDCSNAALIAIPNNGFASGTFNSTTDDLTIATVQPGETFAPAIFVAGQNQKSIWYKFSIPTSRSVRVTLAQPGTAITAGDAGFAIYKTSTCLPVNADISTKLTPLGVFGSTFHPCLDAGDYLIQVSGKASANGPVYISLDIASPSAAYDQQTQAYNFGTLGIGNRTVTYSVDCQSTDDANEVCSSLSNAQQYNKSTWHVFTTPAYFDYISLVLIQQGSGNQKFGFNLYQGDVRTTPYSSLGLVNGCDSLQTTSVAAKKNYKCSDLSLNTTYSIQIFFHQNFFDNIRLSLILNGVAPTQAPEPILMGIPTPSNNMGVLPSNAAGITTTKTDHLACNSRHSLHPCNPSLPSNGILYNGVSYNLSTFFTFTLASTSKITISVNNAGLSCGQPHLVRLYQQGVSSNCATLDTSNLISQFIAGNSLDCLPPGNYTVQVSGRDSMIPSASNFNYNSFPGNSNTPVCILTNLGQRFVILTTVRTINAINKYSLVTPGAYDTLNFAAGLMQPLVNGINYVSKIDTFGCANTVLPWDTTCAPNNTKAIYREFNIGDSGVATINVNNIHWTKLYYGDANSLAVAQNAHTYPSRINGLIPYSECILNNECGGKQVCVIPGTYTLASFGNTVQIGQANSQQVRFNTVNTVHHSLATAEDMGDVTGGAISSLDYYSCKDNAIPINGYIPCSIFGQAATKAIYRQFYLNTPAEVSISGLHNWPSCGFGPSGQMTLFSGKATDGIAGLTALTGQYRCAVSAMTSTACQPLDSGWYTIVTYGSGPSYANPLQNLNQQGYGSYVGNSSQVVITVTLSCPGPKYNRPYRAAIDSVTGNPFLIQWGPRPGHTSAYPKTDTTYTLYRENFNCIPDTPFTSHPIIQCHSSNTKVAYYVFRTTQESYVQIDTKGFWGAVYQGNARTDSALFGPATLIQVCLQSSGYIQICKLQPGDYTLVVFASITQNCFNVVPTIYIDQVGMSRFDHANKAYDFGLIPPDSVFHSGKTGEVNPLDPGRAASNDFIYCTTGARQSDPANAQCSAQFNSQIYNTGVNNDLYNVTANAIPSPWNIPRRNLWYTFTVDRGGYVRVRVNNKTIGKGYQYPFAVFKSDVNGTLAFPAVVASGQVDSTIAQGLSFIGQNAVFGPFYCFNRPSEIVFYRQPCSSVEERYYILVENTNSFPTEMPGMKPNSQMEIAILVDSTNAIQPVADHYYQASSIGTNLLSGTYTGSTDNFSCATKDIPDPLFGSSAVCNKTLWYKFTTSVTGHIRFRAMVNNVSQYTYTNIQLFRQIIPGDSTSAGLQVLNGANTSVNISGVTWAQVCISAGTYYFILPGCNMVDQNVYPIMQIIEEGGDFCNAPVVATLNGAGSAVSSVIVDCHTIGTDYGEFNPTLTCPNGALTSNYKTSWFKIDITGSSVLDVTTFLTENTNALSSDIKYRLMNGNCGAMQERSCVQDAQTQDTYECLSPGSYYIQVFTPVVKNGIPVTGIISLNLSGVVHTDTCAPAPPCLVSANFATQFNCTTDDYVTFVNYSTFGSAVSYLWDFGYNGQTSTAVSPQFNYPILATSQTYTVTLTVINSSCSLGGQISSSAQVTIPGRPYVNLGVDTFMCKLTPPVTLNATTWPGAIYLWQNNSTQPTFNVITPGVYWVNVTYNGCVKRDTIRMYVNPYTQVKQTKYLCGNDSVFLSITGTGGATILWSNNSTNSAIYASSPGLYTNTVNWYGCITRDTFNIIAAPEVFSDNDTTICYPFHPFTLNAAGPLNSSYLWQNNSTASSYNVTSPGTYWVQVNNSTCIKRDTITVLVSDTVINVNSAAAICSGQTYTLPWGGTVSMPGVYHDTLYNASGCDSIRRTLSLSVQSLTTSAINAAICSGQFYTLPSGTIVSTPGFYQDTLHYLSGCDSVIRIVNLTVQSSTSTTTNASICSGQVYTLPWGTVVNTPGSYYDTLYYASGCDSVRLIVNLTTQSVASVTTNASICAGQTYTLPWGGVVSTTGSYHDTLYYVSGCDSIRTTVNLVVQSPVTFTTNVNICTGQSYSLPWGQVVNTAGVYHDTLHYISGCDSIRRTVNLAVQSASASISNVSICSGQNYTLPWGVVVNTSGTYHDTLHYVTGCDSIRRTVHLTLQTSATVTTNVTICSGQSYTLPWGAIVNTAGAYHDTLYYATGCDSLRRTVNIFVQSFTQANTNVNLCSGQSYTLPWGAMISTAGVYHDTLHYITGCDSIRRTVNVTVQSAVSSVSNGSICAGQTYTLPWGSVVSIAGVYHDTLRYVTGCDSIRRTVNLSVQPAASVILNASICAGHSYTLPWGAVVNTPGVYHDTLHYVSGCDSLRRTVSLAVTNPEVRAQTASICTGDSYTLPWNTVVNTAGYYTDTIKTLAGCDSLVRLVTLTVDTGPSIRVSRSNDISCILGTAKLNVSGSYSYQWSPEGSLSNPYIYNPVASPTQSTTYIVTATAANGCSAKDSVKVIVLANNAKEGYLVPSAFTPNNDGKNDCFGVPYWGAVSDFNFTIHSRWGELVFQTNNPGNCWDGLVKGQMQNTGAYIYQISANGICGPIIRKGTVILIK